MKASRTSVAQTIAAYAHPSYRQRINRIGMLFALPALAHLVLFSFYPLLRSFYLSFHSWSLAGTPRYIGLDNYSRLLSHDTDFIRSVKITLTYSILLSGSLFVLALAMALLFDRTFPLRNFFRTVYFIPVVIPWVVTSLVWNLIYNPSYGLANSLVTKVGLDRVFWIQDTGVVIISLIIVGIWKGFGYYMVIFLAGLQGIPPVYYEAAQVDGAGTRARMWHITLPLLRPAMLLVAVTSLSDSFQVFTPVWLMTRGGPAGASRVLTVYIYENAFVYLKMGYATAIATLMVIALVFVSRVEIYLLETNY
jgi:multiple sugar transport system permease protein